MLAFLKNCMKCKTFHIALSFPLNVKASICSEVVQYIDKKFIYCCHYFKYKSIVQQ